MYSLCKGLFKFCLVYNVEYNWCLQNTYVIKVLFVRIQNLVTILENLCVTKITSHRNSVLADSIILRITLTYFKYLYLGKIGKTAKKIFGEPQLPPSNDCASLLATSHKSSFHYSFPNLIPVY